MKRLPLILMTFISFWGCAKNAGQPYVYKSTDSTAMITATTTDSVTYLALGDSYTIGEAVPQAQSFPYQLNTLLSAASFKVHAPEIIATTGWTTDDLIQAIAASNINAKKYDLVTLLIGVNDQYQGLSQENYRIKFAAVLQTVIGFANGDTSRIFVLSIPDYGVTPFANGDDSIIGPQIDQFNAINKEISLKAGVQYLDITPISRVAAHNAALVAPDGLHPSALMYAYWMQQLEPMVATRLNKK